MNLKRSKIFLNSDYVNAMIAEIEQIYDLKYPKFFLDLPFGYSSERCFYRKVPLSDTGKQRSLSYGFTLKDILTILHTINSFKDKNINPKSLWRISMFLEDRDFFHKLSESANEILREIILQEEGNVKYFIDLDENSVP